MGIEPTSHALQAIEYTGFPSLVRVQLRPRSPRLERAASSERQRATLATNDFIQAQGDPCRIPYANGS